MKRFPPLLLGLILLPTLLSAQRKYEPVVLIQRPIDDTIHWYAGTPVKLSVLASTGAEVSVSGRLKKFWSNAHLTQYTLTVSLDAPTPEGTSVPIRVCVGPERNRYCDEVFIVACTPALVLPYRGDDSLEEWQGCRAVAGQCYDPSTFWRVREIPASWYQTRVWFNRVLVFDRPGTQFTGTYEVQNLIPPAGARIRTAVYLKPDGSIDELMWSPLLDTDTSQWAMIHPCGGVELRASELAQLAKTAPAQRQYDTAPVLMIEAPLDDTLYWYAGVPLKIFLLASTGVEVEAPSRLERLDQNQVLTRYVLTLPGEAPAPGGVRTIAVCAGKGEQRYCDQVSVVVDTVALVEALSGRPWAGCRARVGQSYDPSTHWTAKNFPEGWYQTRVWFNDQLVFDRAGTHFTGTLSHRELYQLMVSARVRIRMAVYFKPYATVDDRQWATLLDTDPSKAALIHPCNGVEVVQ